MPGRRTGWGMETGRLEQGLGFRPVPLAGWEKRRGEGAE